MTAAGAGEPLLVWVDAWQLQCCGDPFVVGSRVGWTLHDRPDRDGLSSVLGRGLAMRVTHGEDHHGHLPEGAPTTTGTVARIRAVRCEFGPEPHHPRAGVHHPVPGSADVVEVIAADGRGLASSRLRLVGYLVDLRRRKDVDG